MRLGRGVTGNEAKASVLNKLKGCVTSDYFKCWNKV